MNRRDIDLKYRLIATSALRNYLSTMLPVPTTNDSREKLSRKKHNWDSISISNVAADREELDRINTIRIFLRDSSILLVRWIYGTEKRDGCWEEGDGWMDGWMDGWTCGGNPSNQAWCLIQSMNESRTPNCRSEIFHIRMIWKEWITSWIYWAIVLRVMSVWQFIKAREHFRVPYINYNTISLQ